jgi:hypothetical protein
MNVARLAAKEIGYRRGNFALGVLAVAVAVTGLVSELTLLALHDARAEALGEARAADVQARGARLEDDTRRIMLGLGYNVLVLSADEDIAAFYAGGQPAATMPEAYADRLAASRVITVQHLLPSLQATVPWPGADMRVILIGTRGEVPITHRDEKKPLRPAVPDGGMVIGHVVGERLGLKAGDAVTLLGRTFTVKEVHPARGTADDVSAWVPLADAQAMLAQPGRISAILALSCFCAEATPEGIRREITSALDGRVQVVELSPQAAARRAARSRAAAFSEEATQAETAGREDLRRQRDALAAWVVPLVVVVCAAWVGMLALGNARERRGEIGILRALGVRSGKVFALFMARALVVGEAGALVGYAAGLAVAAVWEARLGGGTPDAAQLFGPSLALAALVAAPLVSAAACLAPAALAARADPAAVLREG